MPTFPNWTLSAASHARIAELAQSAADLDLNPDAVAAGGIAALQTLMALKRAKQAPSGGCRDAFLTRAQEAMRSLEPSVHGDLLQQFQARILALQGRDGDTEIAHVTPGEIVLPQALQTPAVLGALRQAAADAQMPVERLRVGSPMNSVNAETGVAEFAEDAIPEIKISAIRPSENNVNLLARMIYGEAASQSDIDGLYEHIGWTATNRVGAPAFPDTLDGVINNPNEFKSVGDNRWAEFEKPETLDRGVPPRDRRPWMSPAAF